MKTQAEIAEVVARMKAEVERLTAGDWWKRGDSPPEWEPEE